MRIFSALAVSAMLLGSALQPAAAQQYSSVPAGDLQYAQCLVFANGLYQGGMDKSPIPGQTKAEAFCTCMWQETPDDFRGNLVIFSETANGKRINKICEKYSNWGD